jgi:hypothetical protein
VIAHRARGLRRIGALGVAMIVAVASLMLGAAPASAAPTTNYAYPTTHYENVGNPTWCLDGNNTGAYLHKCGHGQFDYQKWQYTAPASNLRLIHDLTLDCLTAWSPDYVSLSDCGTGLDIWNALPTGTTGQVMLQNVYWGSCLAPAQTGIPGRSTYPLVLRRCDVTNTLVKWRYFN